MGEFEQLVMLAVLRLRERAYGVEIRRTLQALVDRDVAAGAVYTTLNRLESKGLVTSRLAETAPERSGQRRRYYRVEPAGAVALRRSYQDVRTMARGLLSDLAELADQAGGTE